MKRTLTTVLSLLILLACSEAGPGPQEGPTDYAVRLASEMEPLEVALELQRAAEAEGEGFQLREGDFAGLGYRLLMEGRIDLAFRTLQAAEILFPDSWRVLENLGEVAIYKGDRELALEKLERAFALDSVNSGAGWIIPQIDRNLMEAARETPVLALFEPGESTGLVGPYLGQDDPGLTPEVFAPGIVSTRGGHEFSCAFSADGREFYFNRGPNIYGAYWEEDGWTAPSFVSFNSEALDHEPFISWDNEHLYFGSGRPREGAPEWGPYGIWRMERTPTGWGDPEFLFPGMYVTLTEDGDAYLTDVFGVAGGGIGVHRRMGEAFGPLERIRGGPNHLRSAHPLVAPDGSYMIFDSDGRLYISFPLPDGTWSEALHLEELDTGGNLMTAALSPDGAYLFYYSYHDIYWVRAEVLDPYIEAFRSGGEGPSPA